MVKVCIGIMVAMSSVVLAAFSRVASMAEGGAEASSWQLVQREEEGKPVFLPLASREQDGQTVTPIAVAFPQRAEIALPVAGRTAGWQESTHWRLIFRLPAGFPAGASLVVYARDNDFLWRQHRFAPEPAAAEQTVTVTIPVRGRAAEQAWEGVGHRRPWTPLTVKNLLEVGVICDPGPAVPVWAGEVLLLSAEHLLQEPATDAPDFYDYVCRPHDPRVGERMEVSFALHHWPSAPFDSEKTDLTAIITPPGGEPERIRAFYSEPFAYDEYEWDKTRCLTPDGAPQYRLRYLPRRPGEHTLVWQAVVDGRQLRLPEMRFSVAPAGAAWRGLVSCDPEHKAFFRWDDGSPFWGLGMNVRSPFDNRYLQVAPYSTWQDMGLSAYRHLFRRYRECGINVVEVWMSSWWLALEWINDAPGFHGVGHYNQYRAWMLDHILELAEENGIYLIIALNNHGKFGMTYDTEWERNPYFVKNGGFLEKCEDYFSDARAHRAFKQTADYICARWGASPNILSWKLFTEIDLTGPTIEYYHDPSVAEWHRLMGGYLKTIDIYKHPVTTHWMLGYHRINDAIANLPELDFVSTDAYYSLGGGSEALVNMLRTGVEYGRKWQKPLVITEYGGSSYADSMAQLMRQVELGLWTGLFNEGGILPMYWWFALVEEKQLYGYYRGVSRFAAGEDRRGMALAQSMLPGTSLSCNELRRDNRLLLWIFDTAYFYSPAENAVPARHSDIGVSYQALQPGSYRLEIWDSGQGIRLSSSNLVMSGTGEPEPIALPDFQRSIAIKIYPLAEAEAEGE